jgi:hypothetical protein
MRISNHTLYRCNHSDTHHHEYEGEEFVLGL